MGQLRPPPVHRGYGAIPRQRQSHRLHHGGHGGGRAHGHAVALMLPQVMRYNYEDPGPRDTYDHYGELLSRRGYAEMPVTEWVERLLGLAALPPLETAGVALAELPELAEDATRQWTGQFNPRKMTAEGFVLLYQGALEGAPAPIEP